MAAGVQQAVLTRFNLQLADGDGRGVDPAWLGPRLELFEEWCAPSVRVQTSAERPWLVLVDQRTPAEALARISAAAGPGAVVVEVSGPLPVPALRERVRDVLADPAVGRARAGAPVLLTTRVDNDDALAPGLLDALRATASGERDEFLNPTRGLQVSGGRVYASRDPSGPFLSLVERRRPDAPPLTAFGVPHRRASRTLPVRQLPGGPWWVQVVHGANIANRVDGVRVHRAQLHALLPHLAAASASSSAGSSADDERGAAFRRDVARSAVRTGLLRTARAARGLVAAGVRTPHP